MLILRPAVRVNERAPPVLFRMATVELTVMSPLPPLPALVCIVTSVPPLSAALIWVSPMLDEVPGSNSPPVSELMEPLTTVTSLGSSSH